MQNKRQSGNVTRWHTIPTIKRQTVAEHSWGVALICMELWPQSKILVEAALCHDLGEYFTGDSPWPVKQSNAVFKKELSTMETEHLKKINAFVNLTDEEQSYLKIADMLEVMYYALEEITMGNQLFKEIFERAKNYIMVNDELHFYHPVLKIINELENRYKELTNAS